MNHPDLSSIRIYSALPAGFIRHYYPEEIPHIPNKGSLIPNALDSRINKVLKDLKFLITTSIRVCTTKPALLGIPTTKSACILRISYEFLEVLYMWC